MTSPSLASLSHQPMHAECIGIESKLTSVNDSEITDKGNNEYQQNTSNSPDVPKGTDADLQCPLFMNSLPSNFASNSGLAAIASLLNEENDCSKDNNDEAPIRTSEVTVKSGGGKASKRRTGSSRHSPYKNKSSGKETSVGEAQLFLSMWKM